MLELKNQVVLVTENGEPTGLAEKMEAHREGWLHLAFSIMVFRNTPSGREYLLQRRAMDKYHSGGLWTNTCCSHPMQNESFQTAAVRRMMEELGVAEELSYRMGDRFCYRAELDNNLVEHELDQILIGESAELDVRLIPEEIMDYGWWPESRIEQLLANAPETFTAWFPEVFLRVKRQLTREMLEQVS
ncbi:isopentenyl-diphosphate Delta-isomerase [Veronia pacifica]|uniref:Isopentenyl-diphosphate Delta-isomerase n=1 Tax=Veronia pacifica TaxID=1080227 RepID=A0A1C3EQ67_9GAMM|nr:isopentenyl-diphosphate Delta-isomerase [Veronia pacifica]ODA35391.1 isopentenyl-diphosphate delta-isomerase [Veronia pacifica]